VERRLAAILMADVVGYSRLMGVDEAGTLTILRSRRTQILEPLITEHHGRVVKLMGDGFLVEFASAVNAVECAIAVQKAMQAANWEVPEDRRLVLRVGINLGDVIVEGSDLYGDGINIAARIQALAAPGAVCVSGKVHAEVLGKLAIGFEDLGEREVKNIARPVRVFQISGDLPDAPGAIASVPHSKPSIAVLAFENMSGDPEQQYFSDGVSEDIITELSRFQSLSVAARNSSFQFQGKAADVKRIGRDLGVQYVVEGSIQKAGSRVRVTAQLIDAATGHHVWAERYDRDGQDIFAVQDEVTRRIAAMTAGRVESAGTRSAQRKPTNALAAYDCVLRGRQIRMAAYLDTDLFVSGALKSARALFERAIRIDPDYARAHAELAWSYLQEWFNLANRKDLDQALSQAQTAVCLDPTDATSQRALGTSYLWLRRYEEAGRLLESAVSANPNDPWSIHSLAVYLNYVGRHAEANACLQKALQLDPYYTDKYQLVLGCELYSLGRYEEALAELRSTDSRPFWLHAQLAACYAQLDRMEEARAEAAAFLDTAASTGRPAGSVAIDRETRLRVVTTLMGAYKQAVDRDRWFGAMRKAGIPV
jgi:adenylate cyclase